MNRRAMLTSLLGLGIVQEPRTLAKLERARGNCPVCQSAKFTDASERTEGKYRYLTLNASGQWTAIDYGRVHDNGLGLQVIPPTHKMVACDDCSAVFLVEMKGTK